MNASFGSRFELKCPFNESLNEGPSSISWFLLQAGNPAPLQSNRTEKKGLLLIFQSLDGSDRSWYRCEYNLGGTQRCFEFNLQTKGEIFFLNLCLYQVRHISVEPVVSLVTLCRACFCLSEMTTTASTMKPSNQAEKGGGNMAVVAPVLTVTVAVAVLTGLLVCRRRVHQRFPPESHQPGRSSAVLCTDMHPHCPSADTVSQSPCDYENIDFQPTESELVPSFTAFIHGC